MGFLSKLDNRFLIRKLSFIFNIFSPIATVTVAVGACAPNGARFQRLTVTSTKFEFGF